MSTSKRKIVYVLGAGFSFGTNHKVDWGTSHLTMPLQNNLLAQIFKFNSKTIKDIDELAKTIRSYFNPVGYRSKRGAGASRHKDLAGLSVEEIVTFFEEMIRDSSDPDEVIRFRGAETYLRRLTLELIEYLSINGRPNQNEILKAFRDKVLATDTIITFNWDTLLDRVLANSKNVHRQWHPAWGYGRTVRELFTYGSSYEAKPSKHATLLKLHGSINWLARGNEFTIPAGFAPDENLDDVVMMPPKMLKREIWGEKPTDIKTKPLTGNWAVHGSKLYPQLWREAEQSLSIAKRIVFIGYSFPAADTSVFGLLRRALAVAKVTDGAYPDIQIVDPNAALLAARFLQSFKIEIPLQNQFLTLNSYVFNQTKR